VKDFVITLQRDGTGEAPWAIHAPWLKLSLVYGIAGPWPAALNWSVEFERYAAARGPESGLPNLTDLAATMLMNCTVTPSDLKRLTGWLGRRENRNELEILRERIIAATGFEDLEEPALDQLCAVATRMANDTTGLRGFDLPKVFRWLAAWAPAYVPMLDPVTYRALTGHDNCELSYLRLALDNLRTLLTEHLVELRQMGEAVGGRLEGFLPVVPPPLRVLESILWFEGYHRAGAGGRTEFDEWVHIEPGPDILPTDRGARWAKEHGG